MFIMIGSFFLAAQGAMIKTLAEQLEIWQIVFLRFSLIGLIILPFALRKRAVKTKRPLAHIGRGIVGLIGFTCMVYAVSHAPLATVTSIAFTRVIFTVILAILIFHETVGWRRWTAVILGFLGVIVMIRPGAAPLDFALLGALMNAVAIAGVIVFLKILSRTEQPETLVLYFSLFGSVVMLVPAILVWRWPDAWGWGLVLFIAAAGALAQSCNVRGWALGEASAMAPLGYFQLIFAGLFGFFLFFEVPDVWTFAGAAIIVTSTLYISIREARLRGAAAKTPAVD
ncbi:MAG: DMT family transporter [Bauldia litoralis]